jgi:hypothetical protein
MRLVVAWVFRRTDVDTFVVPLHHDPQPGTIFHDR